MANPYYIHGGTPQTPPTATAGVSRPLRDEYNAIERGFDRLPTLSTQGNHAVVINGSKTGLTTSLGKVILNGILSTGANIQFSGSFAVTFIVQAATTIQLPSISGTLVTLSGAQTLTNKTLTAPGMNGTVTGNGVWNASVIGAGFGGTGLSSYMIGDLISASGPTTLTTIADVAAGSYLRSAGVSLPVWSTLILPNASVQGDLLISTVANQVTTLAKNTIATRYLANTGASNNPAWAQIDLTNGITGNLPPSRLNGGVFASGLSIWRGDGVWGAIPFGADIFSGLAAFTAPGVYSWTVPAGITRILVWIWGGGGGGSGGIALGLVGGAGSSSGTVGVSRDGFHATPVLAFLTVTPGGIATITIGAGGVGGAAEITVGSGNSGFDTEGGNSTFVLAATTLTSIGGGKNSTKYRSQESAIGSLNAITYSSQGGGGDGPGTTGAGGDVNTPGLGGTGGQSGGTGTDPLVPTTGYTGNNGACIIYY